MERVLTVIGIVDQDAGCGYEAREVVGRIIEAQSPRVGVESGATSSSRATMVATYRVLSEATTE